MNAAQNPLNACPYWVGDILVTMSEIQPAQRWPGTTWVQITDRFLLGAGDTHTPGSTGGKFDHQHVMAMGHDRYWLYMDRSGEEQDSGTQSTVQNPQSSLKFNISNSDVQHNAGCRFSLTQSASSTPPYLAVYIWKRIA